MKTKKVKNLKGVFAATFLSVIISSQVANAACTGASPTWTTTPDYASVNTCITNAKIGDTINVSAGSATWNSMLNITKGINLIGGNGGKTTITYGSIGGGSEQFLIRYDPLNLALNTPFRLSGFTFNLNSAGPWLGLGENYKKAPFTIQDKIRIDHNTVTNGGDNLAIWNYCNFYGVVDNNSFSGFSSYPFKNDSQETEYGYYDNSPQNIFVSGAKNYLYYEDNTISLSGSDNMVWEAQYSARYVARYNTITGVAGVVFEAHGHQSSGGMGSVFGIEAYGNRITQTGYALAALRGGRSFIFNNSVVTTAGAVVNNANDSLVTCPSSYAAEMMIHDTYWWGSRENYTGTRIGTDVSGSVSCNGLTQIPKLGRDVFSDTSTPGVSCGTTENLPATCTVGQGYWATSQSCSNLTNMVGVNPATPISGTLYKCTATNTWTPFYTPYTYPHPLRGGSITQPAQSTLFVTSVNGTVTSNPSGINCGLTCYANYAADAMITLTAIPNSGYTFVGWSGGGCSGTGTCTVSMASAQVVTANYAVTAVSAPTATYYLAVSKTIAGAGTIIASDNTINCGSTCKAKYSAGKKVSLNVAVKSGYKFSRWTGACKGQGATCTVSMAASQNTKAYFAETK